MSLGQSSFFYEEDFSLEARTLIKKSARNEESFANVSENQWFQILSEHLKKNMRTIVIVQSQLHKLVSIDS